MSHSDGSAAASVSVAPRWAHAYLRYERSIPNHPGKRALLRLLLRVVDAVRPGPFAWRMDNGALVAISPKEGLGFAWTVGWTCFQTGRWEPHVERCVRDLLRPGDRAVDVGANLGYFTAVMAQSVGRQGRVWALEPVPPTFERLRLLVSLNGFQNVTALRSALGDVSGSAEMSFDPRFAGSASLHREPGDAPTRSQRVPVHRLDELVDAGTIDPPDLIKIDVEGHELAVLRGALRTISSARPAIVFEYSESLARRASWALPDVTAVLSEAAAYRLFEIRERDLRPIDDPAAYSADAGGYGADLLAVAREGSP